MSTAPASTKKKKSKSKKSVPEVFRGKRKESIARASICKGKGVVRINSARGAEGLP